MDTTLKNVKNQLNTAIKNVTNPKSSLPDSGKSVNLSIPLTLVFFSPIILALMIAGMSFVFQNSKGFIYLGYLFAVVLAREFWIYTYLTSNKKDGETIKPFVSSNSKICDYYKFSPLGNSSFSLFVITFSIFYLCWPMFLNKSVNYFLLGGLIAYLLIDIVVRNSLKCFSGFKSIFVNILAGFTCATIITVPMYSYGASKYLFFNEVSSDKEMCSMPTKQKFKCAVYKNGELIGNTTS